MLPRSTQQNREEYFRILIGRVQFIARLETPVRALFVLVYYDMR